MKRARRKRRTTLQDILDLRRSLERAQDRLDEIEHRDEGERMARNEARLAAFRARRRS